MTSVLVPRQAALYLGGNTTRAVWEVERFWSCAEASETAPYPWNQCSVITLTCISPLSMKVWNQYANWVGPSFDTSIFLSYAVLSKIQVNKPQKQKRGNKSSPIDIQYNDRNMKITPESYVKKVGWCMGMPVIRSDIFYRWRGNLSRNIGDEMRWNVQMRVCFDGDDDDETWDRKNWKNTNGGDIQVGQEIKVTRERSSSKR